jgi:hypothetical protein
MNRDPNIGQEFNGSGSQSDKDLDAIWTQALGERLRLARLRRKLGVDITCERAGISRMTPYRAEARNSAVAVGPWCAFSRS